MRKHLALIVILLSALFPVADATACVKSKTVQVEKGPSPSGEQLSIRAKKSSNGGRCNEWLFQVQFVLPRVLSFSPGTTIPVGGHTPKDFTISAQDGEGLDGLERAFGGYTGREVAKIAAVLQDGSRAEIRTKAPPKELRDKYVWMRGFRYFYYYYPAGSGIQSISLVTKAGRVLYRAHVEPGGTFL